MQAQNKNMLTNRPRLKSNVRKRKNVCGDSISRESDSTSRESDSTSREKNFVNREK